jgi:hypothetical protein
MTLTDSITPRKVILEEDLLSALRDQALPIIEQAVKDNLADIVANNLETRRIIIRAARAAEDINSFRLVAFDDSGRIVRASWDYPRVVGVVMEPVVSGTNVPVIVFGEVTSGSWSFDSTRGLDVFLGGNTGFPVQKADLSESSTLVKIGMMTGSTTFLLNPSLSDLRTMTPNEVTAMLKDLGFLAAV